MDERKFKELMDKWASQEMRSAPEISPSEEVYRKLLGKQKRTRFGFFSWPVRLAAAGLAAALIILVIVLKPPEELEPVAELRKGIIGEIQKQEEKRDRIQQVLGEEEEAVKEEEERKAEVPGKPEKAKGAVVEEERKKEERTEEEERREKTEGAEQAVKTQAAKTKVMEKKEKPKEAEREVLEEAARQVRVKPLGAAARPEVEERKAGESLESKEKLIQAAPAAPSFQDRIAPERIEFQYQPKGSETIQGLDISVPRHEIITLSSEDNYRLFLQLPRERYVYVFQVSADRPLIRLFPNAEFNPTQNPIPAGERIIIPLPPDWFYEKGQGEVQIYVVSSAEPLRDWKEAYAEYSRSAAPVERKKIAAGLLDRIKDKKQSPEDQISIRMFKFYIH